MFLLIGPPTAVTNSVSPETANHILIAIVLACAIGFVEIVKHGVIWILNRNKEEKDDKHTNGYHPPTYFDTELLKTMKDIHNDASESFREIALSLRETSKIQEKLLNKIEENNEDIAKTKKEILHALDIWRRS